MLIGESPLNHFDETPWSSLDGSPPKRLNNGSDAQGNPAAHNGLYETFLEVADYILPESEMGKPVLWHPDLRPSNIFVWNNRITSIIGWRHVWVGPLFLQARHPHLIANKDEMMVRLLDHYESLVKVRDRGDRKRLEHQVQRSIILHCYESEMQAAGPLIRDVMHLPEVQDRRDLVTFSTNTSDGDIVPFREYLIKSARYVVTIPLSPYLLSVLIMS